MMRVCVCVCWGAAVWGEPSELCAFWHDWRAVCAHAVVALPVSLSTCLGLPVSLLRPLSFHAVVQEEREAWRQRKLYWSVSFEDEIVKNVSTLNVKTENIFFHVKFCGRTQDVSLFSVFPQWRDDATQLRDFNEVPFSSSAAAEGKYWTSELITQHFMISVVSRSMIVDNIYV